MLTDAEVKRLLDVAHAGVHKGDVAAARVICRGILAGRPEHVPTHLILALTHFSVGEYDDAQAILEAVLEKHPDDADALAYLGLTMKLAGRAEEADAVFARIPEEAPARKLAEALAQA